MNKIEKNGKKYLVLFLMFLVNNLINKIMREEFSKKVRNLPKVGKHLFLFNSIWDKIVHIWKENGWLHFSTNDLPFLNNLKYVGTLPLFSFYINNIF